MRPSGRALKFRAWPLATMALVAASAAAVDIRISDLSDIDFGSVPPTAGPLINRMDFCVSMSENGRYNVIARGSGTADAFAIRNGFQELPLTVRYTDKPGRPGAQLTPGMPLGGLRAKKRRPGQDCRRPSASIEVELSAASLEAAGPGQYDGVLTLTVSPE